MRLLVALLILFGLVAPGAQAEALVRIEGKNFVEPDGRILRLKGISLGNWLMPEGYMFKFEVAKSPRQIYGAFDRLLGPERAADCGGGCRRCGGAAGSAGQRAVQCAAAYGPHARVARHRGGPV